MDKIQLDGNYRLQNTPSECLGPQCQEKMFLFYLTLTAINDASSIDHINSTM